MVYFHWDRIPNNVKDEVIDYIEKENLEMILFIYIKYNVGPGKYCCPNNDLFKQFKYANDNDLLWQ